MASKIVGCFTFIQNDSGNWVTSITKRVGYLVCDDLIAAKDADGKIDVYRSDGTWLGWCDSNGAVMSMSNPERIGEGRVYSAAQECRYW